MKTLSLENTLQVSGGSSEYTTVGLTFTLPLSTFASVANALDANGDAIDQNVINEGLINAGIDPTSTMYTLSITHEIFTMTSSLSN